MDDGVQIKNTDQKDEKKLDWIKCNNEVKNEITEQERVVQKLKKVLDIFDKVQIKNEDSLVVIDKSLDDLLSSLKYLPVEEGPCFQDLPPELKTDILNYSCNSSAFVAATVCQEWKAILQPKLVELDHVRMCCCTNNGPGCENKRDRYVRCVRPEEILKASIVLKMDIRLNICNPVTNVDSKLLVDGLMSGSKFTIDGHCECREDDQCKIDDAPMMTKSQIKDLFEAMEKVTIMHCVELRGIDMTHLDQDKLMDCLIKIKTLWLADTGSDWTDPWADSDPILDIERFIEKLLEDSTKSNLSSLFLEFLQYPQTLAEDLANALCKVKVVRIGDYFPLRSATLQQLIKNVQGRCIAMESLCLGPDIDWCSLITSEDLKMFITRLKNVILWGRFSQEQLEAARSIPGIKVTSLRSRDPAVRISKGNWVYG